MYWKIGAGLIAGGLFWGAFCYVNVHFVPPDSHVVEQSPPEFESFVTKRDLGGYRLGETRIELLHHLRANGWVMRGPGLFYRPTPFNRHKGECLVVPGIVNCQLPDSLPQMLFTLNGNDGTVARISGYLDGSDDLQTHIDRLSETYGVKPFHISPNDAVIWKLGAGLFLKIQASEFAKWIELYQS